MHYTPFDLSQTLASRFIRIPYTQKKEGIFFRLNDFPKEDILYLYENKTGIMNEIEVSLPRKYAKGGGKETLFRVTIRGQIALIGIMDSKANLIISINTLLITGVLGFLSGSAFFWNNSRLHSLSDHIPFLIFLIFSLAAITFAILATRTDLHLDKFLVMQSPLQFSLTHHKKVPIGDYLKYVEEMLASNDMIYENLSVDLYFLSRVISRKTRFLNLSYLLFLIGLILGITLFIIKILI